MLWRNNYNNKLSSVSFNRTAGGKKIVFFIVLIFLCGFLFLFVSNRENKDSYEYKARMAARKEIPNAEAKQVVVADGFASAIVYVPKDDSQLGSGNTAIFRVNEDGSMTYITSASYFSPVDLLEIGITLESQAKLRNTSIDVIKQELTSSCNYDYYDVDTPGFSDFEGSFNPGGWQIDSASLEEIKQTLGTFIASSNSSKDYSNKDVCVFAKIEGSDVSVDKNTFASTFKLPLIFITSSGVATVHDFSFTDGPIYSRTYILDKNNISSQ